jgi:S1-C subfamily serine protease
MFTRLLARAPRSAVARAATAALVIACGGNSDGPVPGVSLRVASAQTPSTSAFQSATTQALPAVVYIQVEARPRLRAVSPFVPMQSQPQQRAPQGPLIPFGSGSGVFFREGGYILTNNHVVQGAERVTVTLYDRRSFEADVVARDPSTDIAVVRVRGDSLPVARLGTSDSLRLGQWVLALGSPLGLQFSVTAGIVSATGRSIGILASARDPESGEQRAAPLEDFIQTDAAINPGNSGGPLVDLDGRVIGINSAIASPTGTFAGYGFAVPIDLARVVADQLIRYGEVRRPYLGVALDDIEPVDVRVYSLPSPSGAEVIRVESGSPAAKAGIRLGDVIVQIDDARVTSVADLQAALARAEPNTRVALRIIRYGREETVNLTPGIIRSGERPQPRTEANGPARAGLQVAAQGGRVVIAGVQAYSSAARAGVRPGQVVVSANGREIRSVDQLADAVRDARNGALSLIVDDPQAGRLIINYELQQ